jgi:hypothetical protein
MASVRVLHGFEAGMKAGLGMVERATVVVAVLPAQAVSEFAHVAVAALKKPHSVRLVLLGREEGTARALRDAGLDVRVLPEPREVAFVATDDTVLMFPATQGGENLLEVCSVLLPDVLTAAHLRLAFEDTWDRAKAPA